MDEKELPSDQHDEDRRLILEIARKYFNDREVKLSAVPSPGKVSIAMFATHNEGTSVFLKLSSLEKGEEGAKEFSKEQWCLKTAALHSIPSPNVLVMGAFENRAFLILSRILGTSVSLVDRPRVWQTLGRYARTFHQFQSDAQSCLTIPGDFSWINYVNYNLNSLEDPHDRLHVLQVYSTSELDAISNSFRKLRELSLRIGLCHGDLSLRNCLIDTETREVFLFDWDAQNFKLCLITIFSQQISIANQTSEIFSLGMVLLMRRNRFESRLK